MEADRLTELVQEMREDNKGKPEESFTAYRELLVASYEFGKDFYEIDKSIEYNLAFIADCIEMGGFALMESQFHDVAFEVCKNGGM